MSFLLRINKKLQLTKEEKCDIIKNHLKKFKPEETKEKMKVNTLAAEIADVECTGFANYAYLFVRNKIWFKKGVDFFKIQLSFSSHDSFILALTTDNGSVLDVMTMYLF
jgi:hypothetical protein